MTNNLNWKSVREESVKYFTLIIAQQNYRCYPGYIKALIIFLAGHLQKFISFA